MTKQEFDRIVAESVKAGADKKEAEAYVVSGFKIPVDDKGNPVFAAVKKGKSEKG